MQNKTTYIILSIVFVITLAIVIFWKTDNQTETVYIKGKDSVITKSDTVIQYVPKYIVTEKTIVDTVHITHYQTDSSIVKDTVINNMDTVIATITTYPKIDSLKFNLDLRLTEKIINIKDSIWITRVDTLKIFEDNSVWYDNFIFGALSTAIVTILVIFGFQ